MANILRNYVRRGGLAAATVSRGLIRIQIATRAPPVCSKCGLFGAQIVLQRCKSANLKRKYSKSALASIFLNGIRQTHKIWAKQKSF